MTAVGAETDSATGTAAAPPPGGPAATRSAFVVPVAYTVGAAVTTGVGLLLIGAAVPSTYPHLPLLGGLLALLLAAALGSILHYRDRIPHADYASVLALCVFLTLAFYGLLKPTPFGLNGFQGDAWFCSAAVTRFAATWGYADFAYAGLPSFYPPLYFWILGKLAMLFDAPPFFMWRNALIAGGFVWPIVLFWLYRRLVGGAAAAVWTFLLFLVWNDTYLYKPHTFLAYAVFVWWALRFFAPRPLGIGAAIAGAVCGAVLFQLYYYPFFVLGTALLIVAVARTARRDVAGLRSDVPVLGMLGGTVLLSSMFWAPLLASMAGPGGEALSNRWFQPTHLGFWAPIRGVLDVASALALLGLVCLCVRRDATAAVARLLVVACYGWYAIGYVAQFGFDTPLLHFRTDDLVPMLIAPYAALGVVALEAQIAARFGRRGAGAATAVAAVLVAVAGHKYVDETFRSELYRTMAGERYIASNALEAAIVKNLSGHNLLGGIEARVVTGQFPVWSFIAPNAYFSHPAARYQERLSFVREIVELADPAELARRMRNNPFAPIDYVLLQRAEGTEHGQYEGYFLMSLWIDNYPQGAQKINVYFPPRVFEEPYFTHLPVPFGELYRVNRT